MRTRERVFFLLLGVASALGYLAGAWLVPLLALVLLEGSFTIAERLAAPRRQPTAAQCVTGLARPA